MRALVPMTAVAGLLGSVDPLRAADQGRPTGLTQETADGGLRRRSMFGPQFTSVTRDVLRKESGRSSNSDSLIPGLVRRQVLCTGTSRITLTASTCRPH